MVNPDRFVNFDTGVPQIIQAFGVADLRFFGATAGVNSQPAVSAAIAAGFKRVFLPDGFFYQGGGTGAQVGATEIPANLEIIGENSQTSLIKAVDRTNAGVPGFIYLNKFSVLTNCVTQSYPGDQLTAPVATQKTIQQPRIGNFGDAKVAHTPDFGSQAFYLGANLTSPDNVVSTDNPGIQIVEASTGDAYYAGVSGSGVGLRVQAYGNGDFGALIENAFLNPANIHRGLTVTEAGTNASSYSMQLERKASSTVPLFLMLDDNAAGAPAPAFPFSLRTKDSAFGTNAQYLFAGDTKAIRLWTNAAGSLIEGVDPTGVASYQGLTIGGSALVFQVSGVTAASVGSTGLSSVLTGVATPSNANAATAGVPVNGLYRDTADPSKVYVRTV